MLIAEKNSPCVEEAKMELKIQSRQRGNVVHIRFQRKESVLG